MERLRGIASKVDSAVIEYPRSNRSKRTVHISRFQIDGRRVQFESTKRQRINEGDQMIVTGTARGGILDALAYKNLTTGFEGSQGWFVWLFIGVVFGGVGIVIIRLIDFSVATVGQIIVIGMFGGCFFVFSALLLYVGARTLWALNELRKEAP